jgi:2'-5' RNA ligase
MMPTGIFIIGEVRGELGERLAEIARRYDPRLARLKAPHLTLTGSSGLGPLPPDLPVPEITARLDPVVSSTTPLELRFGPPARFMQSTIVVLPLDPHGPLRVLHDRIGASGLPFGRARYTFTPHVTLSLYATLSRDTLDELMETRIAEPFVLDALQIYLTRDPQPARKLLELPLRGGTALSASGLSPAAGRAAG